MSKKELIQLFGEQKVRTKWDDEKQKWFFSIVDVCGVLTDSKDYLTARKYWNKLKQRLKEEGNETVTNCHQLKMVSPKDGKMYKTDVADMEQMFRLTEKGSCLTILSSLLRSIHTPAILISKLRSRQEAA